MWKGADISATLLFLFNFKNEVRKIKIKKMYPKIVHNDDLTKKVILKWGFKEKTFYYNFIGFLLPWCSPPIHIFQWMASEI